MEEDGSLAGTFRLPPLAGAVLLKALRAAAGDLEHPHDTEHPGGTAHPDDTGEPGVSAETPGDGQPQVETSSSLADALLVIAEAFLAGKVATADNPDVYQVIVHVGTDAAPDPTAPDPAAASPDPSAAAPDPAGVSADCQTA
jgi:hypothetical protein